MRLLLPRHRHTQAVLGRDQVIQIGRILSDVYLYPVHLAAEFVVV
jgi:hypothetical protein